MSVPAVADLAPALVIAEREHDIDALRAPHSAGAVLAKCPNMFAQVGVCPKHKPMKRGGRGLPASLSSGSGMPADIMDLDQGEEVSKAEIADIMSELGVAKPKPKPKPAAARPQAATAAAGVVVPAGSVAGPASGPTTGFDLARSRLADYQRAAVQAKQAGNMGRATALLRRSKELKAACDAAARELLATFPPPELADLDAPAAAPTPTPTPAAASVPDELEARLSRLQSADSAPVPAPAPVAEPEPEPDPHREADSALVRAMDSGDVDAIEAAVEEHALAASADVLALLRRVGQRKRAAEAVAAEVAAAPPATTTEAAAPPTPAPPPALAAPPPAPLLEEKEQQQQQAEEGGEEDHVLAAEAYAAQLTSYNVLQWELGKLQGGGLDEAAEERLEGE